MKTVFADTDYFIAQFNSSDISFEKAVAFTDTFVGRMVTTDWVIVELADAFARPPNRERFVALYQQLTTLAALAIVPAERALLLDGLALYAERPDKEWSLTDCISFVVMKQQGILEAATADRHFEQAGFVALLK
ncbi:MAG: type II toxin-antitoxin system VapC family toxin [Gemmataceae bacterium]